MQKGLDLLLNKYSVSAKAVLSADGKTVMIDGKEIPVLPWESERRIIELRNLVVTGRLGNMCTYRIGHNATKGTDLFEMLAREVGILEFTVNSTAKEIFAIAGANTMNCIVETENGCVCTIELGATLEEGQRAIDKHEIITDNGVPITLSMNIYLYDALLKLDKSYKDFIIADIDKKYKRMLDKGATTFWETEKGCEDQGHTGSLCHGWAAMPIYYYTLLNGEEYFNGKL